MNVPNFQNIQVIGKGGFFTDEWQNMLQQLITQMQNNLSDEGFHIPQQTAANIAILQTQFAASPDPSAYNGVMLYDTTNDLLKVNIAGTFKTVTTS